MLRAVHVVLVRRVLKTGLPSGALLLQSSRSRLGGPASSAPAAISTSSAPTFTVNDNDPVSMLSPPLAWSGFGGGERLTIGLLAANGHQSPAC